MWCLSTSYHKRLLRKQREKFTLKSYKVFLRSEFFSQENFETVQKKLSAKYAHHYLMYIFNYSLEKHY
jgi:hypothetical protein